MPHSATTPSAPRLARLRLWARLWLDRLAIWLLELCGDHAPVAGYLRRDIERMGQAVAALILLSAEPRLRPRARAPWRSFHPSRRVRDSLLRRIIGARLRRRLRGEGGVRARLAALRAALADLEPLIAALVARIDARAFAASRLVFTLPEGEPGACAARGSCDALHRHAHGSRPAPLDTS